MAQVVTGRLRDLYMGVLFLYIWVRGVLQLMQATQAVTAHLVILSL